MSAPESSSPPFGDGESDGLSSGDSASRSSASGDAADPSTPPRAASAPPPRPALSSLGDVVPPLDEVTGDLPLANRHECKSDLDETEVVTCTRGDISDPALTVALVGDSFAGEWSSALAQIAAEENWKLVTVTHDGCPFSAAMVLRSGEPYPECHQWGELALDYLLHTLKPDVMIVSFHPGQAVPEHPEYGRASERTIADGMVQYWRQLSDAGVFIVGIKPTPDPRLNVPDCLSSRGGSIDNCTVPRSKTGYNYSAIGMAVRAMGPGRAIEIDMDDYICDATACPPVVGNVVVYRDEKHISRTYSMTLAPYLKQQLMEVPQFSRPTG